MKTISELLDVVRSGLSHEDGEAWSALEQVRSSLTSVPKDVARDVETVRGALSLLLSDDVGQKTEGNAALSRLATAAALVPGLEASVAEAREEVKVAREEFRAVRYERDERQERLTAVADERDDAIAQRDAALELSRTAESERDAAWQEVERLKGEVTARAAYAAGQDGALAAIDEALDGATIPEGSTVARVRDACERLLSSQNAAAALEETGAEVIDLDPTAPGGFVADDSGSVLRFSPDLPARWRTLTARVAEVEQERDELRRMEARRADERDSAEARATAAEAKVASARNDGLEEAARLCSPKRAGEALLARLIRERKSQPAPTPTPGLREAVMSYEEFRKKHPAARNFQQYTHEQRANHAASHRLGYRQRTAIGRYFYTHPMIAEPICFDTAKQATQRAYEKYLECARVGAVDEWLAAYDATPPSAGLAALVEQMIAETTRVCGTKGYAATHINALREVLRRYAGGQVPPVAEWKDKAAKWDAAVERTKDADAAACALLGIPSFKGSGMPPSHKASWRAKAQTFSAWLLGLTLPTGQGGNPSMPSNGSGEPEPSGE